MRERLLLVEDRENLRILLHDALCGPFDVDVAGDGARAVGLLGENRYAVVVTDVRMPGADGTRILEVARALPEAPEVILMTGYAEVPAAVAALRAGAYDYLAKPFETDHLVRVAIRAAERHTLLARTRALEARLTAQESGFVGTSGAASEVRRWLERVGRLPVPVLLTGESGAGKEVAAREIHRLYGKGSLVALNCGAIPENLLEAEVFGAAKGAYTGSNVDRPGLLEAADGGTLLLDEIGDLPLSLQVKLNRVLEEGEYRRVGETRARKADVRFLAATHRDLEQMVADGTFRQDLYFRLKVVQIRVPPLRERVEDIPLLAAQFLHVASARFGTAARRLAPDALVALERHSWPGNVRELRHALEHAAVVADGDTIKADDLPDELRASVGVDAGTYRAARERGADLAGRDYLIALMRRVAGNVTRAAADAGMERESMHRALRNHGIDPARYRP